MNSFQDLPSPKTLLEEFPNPFAEKPLLVNNHFHTPFSFSAFNSIVEIFEQAEKEGVDVLGINDFITTSGYSEFNTLASEYKKFPLFNIEFMGLMKEEQANGIRINDPNNPGRIYFCGKGLAFPSTLNFENRERLDEVFKYSVLQAEEMVQLVNKILERIDAPFSIDFLDIREQYTKGLVRERHIAMAIRIKVLENFEKEAEIKEFLSLLYGGKTCEANVAKPSELDNEIRGRLLKSGGQAFVAEDDRSFLSLHEMIAIIRDAKGIPCYPVLLDDPKGNIIDFEKDANQLVLELSKRRVFALELIPGRNDLKILKDFVNVVTERGFVVTFGTEHNTPENEPLEVSCRGGVKLDEDLLNTSYQGASIIAAHQYLVARGEDGYLTNEGFPRIEKQDNFIALGNAIIRTFINS